MEHLELNVYFITIFFFLGFFVFFKSGAATVTFYCCKTNSNLCQKIFRIFFFLCVVIYHDVSPFTTRETLYCYTLPFIDEGMILLMNVIGFGTIMSHRCNNRNGKTMSFQFLYIFFFQYRFLLYLF